MKQIERAVKGLQNRLNPKGQVVKVGLPEASGDHEDSGIPIVMIGAVHEYGIGVPMRSFLRVPLSDQSDLIAQTGTIGAKAIADGRGTMSSVLATLGEVGVSISNESFSNNDWAPLKDPTRGGKNKDGNSQPLWDTGTMKRSITYQVKKED